MGQNFWGGKKYLWSAHFFRPGIFFRPEIYSDPKFFSTPQFFSNQNFFLDQTFFQKKIADPEFFKTKILTQTFSYKFKTQLKKNQTQNFFGPKFFWQKNLLADQTYFCTKNFVCPNMQFIYIHWRLGIKLFQAEHFRFKSCFYEGRVKIILSQKGAGGNQRQVIFHQNKIKVPKLSKPKCS